MSSESKADEIPLHLNDLLPTTPDGREERLAVLKRLFPDLFTNEGRLNPEELKQLVEPNEVHEAERYEFKWYGKAASKREAFTPTTATLVYDEKRSVNPDKADGNMIIEGENLETLKLLLNAYREQVKCIYIDPPYNTGKDFIYRDNYKKDKANYWEETGVAENGIQLDSNPDTSGRYHSDWLSMMQARLFAAHKLLTQDGAIFVSCDDNEVFNLRQVMNHVFGEENFAGILVWQKSKKGDSKLIAKNHEYVVVYAKSRDDAIASGTWRVRKEGVDEVIEQYEYHREIFQDDHDAISETMRGWYSDLKEDDSRKAHAHYKWSDARGLYFAADFAGPDDGRKSRPRYDIIHPVTGKPCKKPSTGWRWDEERTKKALQADPPLIHFGPDETTIPCRKSYLKNISSEALQSVFYRDGRGATLQVEKILGEGIFEFPKDPEVISKLVELCTEPGDLILDFFSGSGATAHACLSNFAKDDYRRFISVQIPEATPEGSRAREAGFKTISAITIERVKRVIEGYGDDPQPMPGAGFKVYKLQKSNFPRCEFRPDPEASEADNVESLKRYIEEKEAAHFISLDTDGEQAVFDEVLLKNGFQLNYTRTLQEDFTDNTFYEVSDGRRSALACLAWHENIADGTIKKLRELAEADERPHFICLERGLTTTAKWNLKHFLGNHFNAF